MRFLSLIFILIGFSGFSQQKFEREYRIKLEQVPTKSQQIVKMWDFQKKVKWYAEESQDGKTYEAKVCYKSKKHSLEFSEKGELLDVEIKVSFKKLQKNVQKNVTKTLSEKFKKFKIRKTQIQYKGNESEMYKAVFKLKTHHQKINPLYEFIVKGKKESNYHLYEILIDEKGIILKELQFAPQNTDNLEF